VLLRDPGLLEGLPDPLSWTAAARGPSPKLLRPVGCRCQEKDAMIGQWRMEQWQHCGWAAHLTRDHAT
jgi:hypothetical protein